MTYLAVFLAGLIAGAIAVWLARRELDLYRRATGQTVDFTATSRGNR